MVTNTLRRPVESGLKSLQEEIRLAQLQTRIANMENTLKASEERHASQTSLLHSISQRRRKAISTENRYGTTGGYSVVLATMFFSHARQRQKMKTKKKAKMKTKTKMKTRARTKTNDK